jgi:hypothetical protein
MHRLLNVSRTARAARGLARKQLSASAAVNIAMPLVRLENDKIPSTWESRFRLFSSSSSSWMSSAPPSSSSASGGGHDDGDGSEAAAHPVAQPGFGVPATLTVPEIWPVVPVIAINKHPVFPKFIKIVVSIHRHSD